MSVTFGQARGRNSSFSGLYLHSCIHVSQHIGESVSRQCNPPMHRLPIYTRSSTYLNISHTFLPRLISPTIHPLHQRQRAMSTNGTYKRPRLENDDPSNALPNNFLNPGPAAFDLRSDVVTTPTPRMLAAIQHTTLLDDVFQQDPTTNNLESFIAELTDKEASLLVLSGTMGNQVAIRAHLGGPPHSVVCDSRAHIICHEAGGVSSLTGAMTIPVEPANGGYLTLEDVQRKVVISDNVHACPTKLISLENTLNGVVMPLAECQRISEWARDRGIIMHLDGARLWEAVASGAGTLREYCACFDSISLCFSKGLGAPIGSIVIGTATFVKRARWIRKSIGGGLRQSGVVAAPARVAVEDTFLGGLLAGSHQRAKVIEGMWQGHGGKLVHPVETNMVWVDLDAAGVEAERWVALGEKAGLRLGGGRMVIHYQVGEEAVERLGRLFKAVFEGAELDGTVEYDPVSLMEATKVAR